MITKNIRLAIWIHGKIVRMKEPSCCHAALPDEPPRLGRNLKISLVLLFSILAVSFLPYFEALNSSLLSYMKMLALPLLAGFLLGGAVDYFVPEGFIYRYFDGKRKRSLFYAFAAGFLMSTCSHGILAMAIQIYKKGAGVPAVITFLLASPWANFPVTILPRELFRMEGSSFHRYGGIHSDYHGFYLPDS